MRRSALLLALALSIAGCDQRPAQPEESYIPRPSGHTDNGWPPLRFRDDVILKSVEFVQPGDVAKRCGVTRRDIEVQACARLRQDGNHTVILPNPCRAPKSEDWAKLACHEIGHINGWPADHGA